MSKHKQPSFIDPQALRELVRCDEKVVIVDVRSPEEFAAGHVEGAINIPSDQLAAQAGVLPVDANIVTVCNLGGARSCNAAKQLHQMGYEKAVPLQGGTRAWLEGKE
ncbi:rhodanese-like domain-containing protein [Citrobacter portucalensis]|uniref:rhodanese-like domain-containing protein n=1 Tax=Citrobacter freundii TaxID=546 RepID=UPI000C158125|nr:MULTISPECIES: rhodanese-like domain-containing protein [Citrobacter freundii complex]MEB1083484.1 rhodanese-like domain-containing protein [Citrobacter portucalensis]PHZ02307.1 sulfurtransferase [Citrobacter freundii]